MLIVPDINVWFNLQGRTGKKTIKVSLPDEYECLQE